MTAPHQADADLLSGEDLGLGSDPDPHLLFWRRQALARSKRIGELERVVANLRAALYEIEEQAREARS